jgi:lysyl-tRNA synthetase class 1
MKLSQLERGADPADSLGGVSFRHLSMLAQIKSSDEDVWTSMRASGHLTGEPNESLSQRLTRMRNWIGSIHFPEDAQIHIHKSISAEARAELSEEQRVFLSSLAEGLAELNWSEQAIGATIRTIAPDCGISGRDAYIALYWAMLGRNHGPKASSLLFEIGKNEAISLLSS